MELLGLNIELLGHASVRINNKKIIYIDPFELTQISENKKADYILITHPHYDHCSPKDIEKISDENTTVITVADAQSKLSNLKLKEIKLIEPKQAISLEDMKVTAVPAYNIDKWRSEGIPYHPKENCWVGFIIEINGVKVYHSGDTDAIPEMKDIETDIALLPVGGVYTMTAAEAAEATKTFRSCRLAIPIHYGSIVGTASDAEAFKEKAGCKVKILM